MTTIQETVCEYPVLLVDDDPFMRRVLSDTLKELGYEVVTAANGREALEIAGNGDYPLILSDWVMPEMDGLELCRNIRGTQNRQHAYIILLTSLDTRDNIVQGLEAGANEYLVKPVNQAELTVRLKTARRIIDLERSLKRSLEEIRLLSLKDPLTGAFNRRYLDDRLPQEIKRACRFERSLSILMMDIDHFKKVNDTYGHQAGDLVLKASTDALTANLRGEVDWIARYGGEEFVIVLPETPPDGMMVVAERLRKIIAALRIDFEGRVIEITASFGAASYLPAQQIPAISSTQLIELADRCLYNSKQTGRNKVTGSRC